MSLSEAIDVAIAFVKRFGGLNESDTPRDYAGKLTPEQLVELGRIADEVYVLAHRNGLDRALPQVEELSPILQSDELPQVQFETKLNLPGDWTTEEPSEEYSNLLAGPLRSSYPLDFEFPEPPARVYLFVATTRWFHDLAMLRELATQPQQTPMERLEALPKEALMSHADLAKTLSLDPEPLRSRLNRWRKQNFEGWEQVDEKKARQPSYLYRVGAVCDMLRDALNEKG